MQRTRKVIEIDAPVERVFDFFSDFESFPRWMRNIKEVRYSGRRYTRWTADAPFGTSVEWEAETTSFEPDHRIAWRSVRGDVYTEGEVLFEETRRGTTRMRVALAYDPPAGRLGALVAHLFGKDPERQLEEDLECFAYVVEGRPRARRRRFEESLREARRSQLEGRRRYREERARDEERRHDERREREERRFEEDDRRHRPPFRHPMTPREWEREQERRQPDYDYSREAFRRGIDKLMDAPPSRRWHRWD